MALRGCLASRHRRRLRERATFDSQLGFVVRRWCAPVLDLDPLVPASEYVRRRLELGSTEASRRLLTAAEVGTWLVDTGYQSDALTTVRRAC